MNCMSLKKYIAKTMILALLKEKDTDGYEIALETARYTNFSKGKIYPLLLRFRKNQLISAYFRKSESGFFRKYYKITPPGRLKHLSNMTDTQHLYHMIRKILITGGMKMTRTEFMSLLQYYLKKSSAEETADIVADYNAHFDVAEDAGFSDEDIIKELGSPKEIYHFYRQEGLLTEKSFAMRLSQNLFKNTETVMNRVGQNTQKQLARFTAHLPALTSSATDILSRLLYIIGSIAAAIAVSITLLAMYMLAVQYQPFPWMTPFPSMHPLTLAAIGGAGLSTAGALFFAGQAGKSFYESGMPAESAEEISINNQ